MLFYQNLDNVLLSFSSKTHQNLELKLKMNVVPTYLFFSKKKYSRDL